PQQLSLPFRLGWHCESGGEERAAAPLPGWPRCNARRLRGRRPRGVPAGELQRTQAFLRPVASAVEGARRPPPPGRSPCRKTAGPAAGWGLPSADARATTSRPVALRRQASLRKGRRTPRPPLLAGSNPRALPDEEEEPPATPSRDPEELRELWLLLRRPSPRGWAPVARSMAPTSPSSSSLARRAALATALVLLYYTFSIGITFYNKWLMKTFGFPLFMTLLHLLVIFLLSGLARRCARRPPRPLLPWPAYLRQVAPAGEARATPRLPETQTRAAASWGPDCQTACQLSPSPGPVGKRRAFRGGAGESWACGSRSRDGRGRY
uniref:Uncharacterized protein n=1 Tax=Salvator merianae TaxID=96440 RepID=A0A8D0E4T6_SALMN